jgi:hypothetical protein
MKIQSIRGMNDLLPQQSALWQYLERAVADMLDRYGYREIRFPILEQTELFKRAVGEVTDIVEKEMYCFDDRNGDSLSLRPREPPAVFAPVAKTVYCIISRSGCGIRAQCFVMSDHKKVACVSSIKLVLKPLALMAPILMPNYC